MVNTEILNQPAETHHWLLELNAALKEVPSAVVEWLKLLSEKIPNVAQLVQLADSLIQLEEEQATEAFAQNDTDENRFWMYQATWQGIWHKGLRAIAAHAFKKSQFNSYGEFILNLLGNNPIPWGKFSNLEQLQALLQEVITPTVQENSTQ